MHFGASFSESRKLSACRARPLARLRKSSIRAWAAQGDESCRVDSAQNCIRCWRERLVFLLGLVCARRVLSVLVYVCVCVWKVRKKFLNKCICMYMCVCACMCVCTPHTVKVKISEIRMPIKEINAHEHVETRSIRNSIRELLKYQVKACWKFLYSVKIGENSKKPKETTEKIQYIRVWHTYRQMYIYF